jgi:hypothetical protein
MMQTMLIATGNGYEGCKAFDGYEIVAAPLPGYSASEREARVFNRKADGHGGTCYGSHTISLAKQQFGSDLYLLVSHGGGREVWRVPMFYDGGDYQRALLAMPERLQYAALYTLYRMASESRREGADTTRREYNQAFVEKRLKKSRPKQGCVRVYIEPRGAQLVQAV